jgi:predicted transposase/invertase (TIGR01784 family)
MLEDRFIVEVQRARQKFFKDRSLFYASHAIQDQAQKGKTWIYELRNVYTISLLDFIFDEEDLEKVMHRVKLTELESKKIFYDKLTFIYLEIPKFSKELAEIDNDFERWLYAFKNLHTLRDKPAALREGIFERLMELAEIAKMDTQEKITYNESLKNYRDMLGVKAAYIEEGEWKRDIEFVKDMLSDGFTIERIMKYSKLSKREIENLREKSKG